MDCGTERRVEHIFLDVDRHFLRGLYAEKTFSEIAPCLWNVAFIFYLRRDEQTDGGYFAVRFIAAGLLAAPASSKFEV